MPKLKFKLPSRNWMIFLSITGSFAAAITYDRRQKKAVQQKWCNLVSHLASEPLSPNELRRKLTVVLAPPPGDSLGVSRSYFKEYIKPVLVAASIDYELIEGRKEGDVRYGIAEQIRRKRRKLEGVSPNSDNMDAKDMLDEIRSKNGVKSEPGIQGDVVVGRQTWKEYIRGLHEGWLGPLEQPEPQASPGSILESLGGDREEALGEQKVTSDTTDSSSQSEGSDSDQSTAENEKPTEKPYPPPAYLPLDRYADASLSSTVPATFEPSASIPHPHILGFLNTPTRIYRFLNQRHLADDIGRQTAAIVLGSVEPYRNSGNGLAEDEGSSRSELSGEQDELLRDEESQWHKSIWKAKDDGSERVWLDSITLDPRVGERMRKFVLHENGTSL